MGMDPLKHPPTFSVLFVQCWCGLGSMVVIFHVPWLWARCGAVLISISHLYVHSKCRSCSRIFCSVLTWSPFEVDKYQLFKQKIKQKQLKTYSEVNRWTVCKTKQFPKGIFSTWSLFNSWLKINNADRVCVGGLWYMNGVSTVGW